MKLALSLSAFLLASSLASAASTGAGRSMHDGVEGNCQDQAQAAIDALDRINNPSARQIALVLKGQPTQVETYTSGGARPQYKIKTVAGVNGSEACAIIAISYNPQP